RRTTGPSARSPCRSRRAPTTRRAGRTRHATTAGTPAVALGSRHDLVPARPGSRRYDAGATGFAAPFRVEAGRLATPETGGSARTARVARGTGRENVRDAWRLMHRNQRRGSPPRTQ